MNAEKPKTPLKSRFTFRIKAPNGSQHLNSIEYLFDDQIIGREDWVALQQHLFLKAVGSEGEDGRSIFERVFGKDHR